MGCAKFFGRFLLKPKPYYCPYLGSCPLDIKVQRCKACLLQACINTYILDDSRRAIAEANKPLKRAAPLPSQVEDLVPSSLSLSQRQSPSPHEASSSRQIPRSSSSSLMVERSPSSSLMVERSSSSSLMVERSSSSSLVSRQVNPIKKSIQRRFIQLKKTVIQSAFQPKQAVGNGTALFGFVKPVTMTSPNTFPGLRKQGGCKQCPGCLKEDCGKCNYCRDKPKFGGPNTLKKKCAMRRCHSLKSDSRTEKVAN